MIKPKLPSLSIATFIGYPISFVLLLFSTTYLSCDEASYSDIAGIGYHSSLEAPTARYSNDGDVTVSLVEFYRAEYKTTGRNSIDQIQVPDARNARRNRSQVEIRYVIENRGPNESEVQIVVMGQWLVAPRHTKKAELQELENTVAWTDQSLMERKEAVKVPVGRTEFAVRNLNLVGEARKLPDDTLWPFKFRAVVLVQGNANDTRSEGSGVLTLLPPEFR